MAKRSKYKRHKKFDVMASKAELKWIILPCIIVLIGSFVWYLWYANRSTSTIGSVEYIASYMTSTGKINDFQNKIGAKDVNDIKWFETDKEYEIQFGKITLTWRKDEFLTQETNDLLKKIFMAVGTDEKTGEIIVYFKGSKVEKWVK